MFSANEQIKYDTRAESNWSPKLFDTGTIDGSGSIVLGNELAASPQRPSRRVRLARECRIHFLPSL
jgi:hypothetical protein